jgi:hypothetical protein
VTRAAIETRILSLYAAGCEAEAYNIREISLKTNAAYPHVYAAVQEMVKRGLLVSSVVGKAVYCRINLANDLARNLLCQALIRKQETALAKPNLKNLAAELRRLAREEPRLLAVVLNGERLRCLVTDAKAARPLLRKTDLPNISFSTPAELREELIGSMAVLDGALIFLGYERVLLTIEPIQEQLLLNHSALFRSKARGTR